jgi:chemotaxis signal transduction protein
MTFATYYTFQPTKTTQTERIELLLVEIGDARYAIRAAHIMRLAKETNLQLRKDKFPSKNQNAYLGYIRQLDIPVYDLNILLGEEACQAGGEQVVIMKDDREDALVYGFRVNNATEVASVNLNELVALPEIVENNKTEPLVWAMWVKHSDPTEQITSLINPIAIVKDDELK